MLHRIVPATVLAAVLATLGVGIHYGTFTASDSDPYGYVSEADLIARGSLRIEQQFARTMPWPLAEWTFAPLGYRPAPSRGFIVPTYPAGLPLLMGAFQRVAGRDAVFYVVPLLGALAIWITARLGGIVDKPLTGALAAMLLASSPTFLRQVIQPVSDVPATAWWTVCLALALQSSLVSAIGAGIAAGFAILTRPNLVALAAIVAGFYAIRVVRPAAADCRRSALIRLAAFACGTAAGCLAVAAINRSLYGSALRFGYAELDTLYAWANVVPNLDRYPRWLVESETPFMCLAVLAPWLTRRRPQGAERPPMADAHIGLLIAFAAGVFASYLFYIPFGRDDRAYLRFLLPAYPPLIVLSVAAADEMLRRVPRLRRSHAIVIVGICGGLAAWHIRGAAVDDTFELRQVERRYVDVGRYATVLPREAVFIAGLHTGSIRYYSGRLTLRYDLLQPGWLDEAVRTLAARGYHPYIALEQGEEPDFRRQFVKFSDLSRLDWPPAAERRLPVRVRIYDPSDRVRFLAGETILTGDITTALKTRN